MSGSDQPGGAELTGDEPTAVTDLAAEIRWDERGLAPAVVCHAETGAVLMLGWMNAEALAATRASGLVHFYSRSRQALWRKGETSGHTLAATEIRLDCDGDALLVTAHPAGPTCHTGKPSCFFRRADPSGGWVADAGPTGPPVAVLERLFAILASRRGAPPETSYTASLLARGGSAIAAKLREEAGELAAELEAAGEARPEPGGAAGATPPGGAAGPGPGDPGRIAHEAADVIYHLMVGLLGSDVASGAVWRELERRFGQSGHAEKASRR